METTAYYAHTILSPLPFAASFIVGELGYYSMFYWFADDTTEFQPPFSLQAGLVGGLFGWGLYNILTFSRMYGMLTPLLILGAAFSGGAATWYCKKTKNSKMDPILMVSELPYIF